MRLKRSPIALTTLAALAAISLLGAEAKAAETRDPDAVAVAKKTLDAMGGPDAFAHLRTLKFDFVVVREGKEVGRYHHAWDRWDGRYRVEGMTRDGKHALTIFNVQKRDAGGRAWLDGRELSGEELKGALERAYGRFINDSYWLLMPAKLLDPGVDLAMEGTKEVDGKSYDVVRVSFEEHVGLTPQDTYWAYVSKDSGLMERWEFVLTGQKPEDKSTFAWSAWSSVGPVKLAMDKSAPDGKFAIKFENVSGSTGEDAAAFAAP